MKWFFFLLLAANVGFGGYVWLREHAPNPDAQLARLQVNPEQLKIIPAPQRPAAPTPAPVTQGQAAGPASGGGPVPASNVCVEWGSFGGGELARAQLAVDRLALGERVRRIEVAVTVGYWVYIPPMKTRAEMERKTAELRELGISDYYPVTEANRWRYAISLGIFRNEDGAKKYLATLRNKGVRSAVAGSRDQRVSQTAFLIRGPSDEDSANLVVLKSEFPGSDLRAVECPAS